MVEVWLAISKLRGLAGPTKYRQEYGGVRYHAVKAGRGKALPLIYSYKDSVARYVRPLSL